MLAEYPAFIRLYDCLLDGETDCRTKPFSNRRKILTNLASRLDPHRFDVSEILSFSTWAELEVLRKNPPPSVVEGVMLQRWNSVYQTGRPKGLWFKWKRVRN